MDTVVYLPGDHLRIFEGLLWGVPCLCFLWVLLTLPFTIFPVGYLEMSDDHSFSVDM